MTRTIKLKAVLPYNQDKVWQALTDPKLLGSWFMENNIQLIFIQSGEPTQNAFIERLNGTFRRDILNAYVFKSIQEVKNISKEWMHDYNFNRPHKSLENKTPMEYRLNQ